MMLLDPRLHGAAIPRPAPPAKPMPRVPFDGARIEANGGGSVLVRPGATRRQLLELRQHIDRAIEEAGA